MAIKKYNDFISQIAAGITLSQPIYGDQQSSTARLLGSMDCYRVGTTKVLPSLPSGVTAFIPTRISWSIQGNTALSALFAKVVNLGSIDISGASGTFTDGSSMPTITECGVSRVTSGIVIAEVTTALNATPGSLQIDYVDQDGNAHETNTAQALTASAPVGDCGIITLNTGDKGVQDIVAATRSAGTTPTGVIKFWGIIPLAIGYVPTASSGVGTMENLLTGAFNPYRLGAGDVIKSFQFSALACGLVGDIYFVGDN